MSAGLVGTSGVRIIVCGSRDWRDRKAIADVLNGLVLANGWRYPDPTIVHGAARGADRLADEEAGKAGLLTEPHRPDYERWGKKQAPLKRNEEMAALGATLCVAFWDGKSTGTAHMLDCARRHGIPVQVYGGTTTPEASPVLERTTNRASEPDLSEPRSEARNGEL